MRPVSRVRDSDHAPSCSRNECITFLNSEMSCAGQFPSAPSASAAALVNSNSRTGRSPMFMMCLNARSPSMSFTLLLSVSCLPSPTTLPTSWQ